jgi:hypothetical protein
MLNSRLVFLLAAFALGACAAPAPVADAPTRPAAGSALDISGAASIGAEEILGHITYLASDELKGRDTPSPGLEAAAEYIASAFGEHGLEPAGDEGGFMQRWPYVTATMNADVTQLLVRGGEPASHQYGVDFFSFTSSQRSAQGEAVYVGPLEALESLPVDAVRGRIVLALLPGAPTSAILEAGGLAASSGAAGLVLVLDPGVAPQIIRPFAAMMEDGAGPGQPIPTFALLYRSARQLAASGGLDLDQLVRSPPSSPVTLTGTTLELITGADVQEHRPPNVVGIVRGGDPALRDTYIAISAHFDHVGIGQPVAGDSIYNGADDNASGTSALMAIARALALRDEPLPRSVILVAVSGEEKGLLGSDYFVENPPVPLERIVANINLDMIGRNHPDSLVIIGEDFSTLGPLAHRVASDHPNLRLTLAPDPDPSEQVFFRSDHFSFARRGIPAIFFTTWLHADYHQPSDRVERIDADKVARVAQLVYHLTDAIATNQDVPEWTPAGRATMRAIGH